MPAEFDWGLLFSVYEPVQKSMHINIFTHIYIYINIYIHIYGNAEMGCYTCVLEFIQPH